MARNTNVIPFTELVERVQELTRSPDNTKKKIRGVIQDIYVREIPAKFDWTFLWTSSGMTTVGEYKEGTVAINTGASSVVFTGATIDTGMTGRKIKINGNGTIYNFTYSDSSAGTLSPTFEGPSNADGNSYSIFQPTYALASDFDRFPKNGGLYKWDGGSKELLQVMQYQEYYDQFSPAIGTPERMIMGNHDTAGVQLVEVNPAPSQTRNYGCDYIKQFQPMNESSDGTVSIPAKGNTVTGTGTRFTEMATGDYLRVDSYGTGDDSSWYRVINVQHDSSLTLQKSFDQTAATGEKYVISKSPEMPPRMHPAVLFGALTAISTDQNDQNNALYHMKFAETMSDGKRMFVTRIYNQELKSLSDDYLYRR